ncbi:MAG: hypothetical protein PVH50_09450, partial [Anaerolineae bacterium]
FGDHRPSTVSPVAQNGHAIGLISVTDSNIGARRGNCFVDQGEGRTAELRGTSHWWPRLPREGESGLREDVTPEPVSQRRP